MKEQLQQLEKELVEIFNTQSCSHYFNGELGEDYKFIDNKNVELDGKQICLSKDRGMLFVGNRFEEIYVSVKQFFIHKVIPEIDAYCFAKIANSNIKNGSGICESFTTDKHKLGSIYVPKSRFYSDIEIFDGKDNYGGYAKAKNGKLMSDLTVDISKVCLIVNIKLSQCLPVDKYKYCAGLRIYYDLVVDEE